MIFNDRGFSLIELMTTLAVIAIVSAIALPAFNTWMDNAVYRETAQNILQTLSKARSLAISSNLEYRVDFEIGNRRYRLLRGDQSSGSTFTPPDTVIDWTSLPSKTSLRGGAACDGTTDTSIVFNPNGTTDSGADLCIVEASTPSKDHYKINVNDTSGRSIIQ